MLSGKLYHTVFLKHILGGGGGALLVQCYDKRNEITRRKFTKAYFNMYTGGGGGDHLASQAPLVSGLDWAFGNLP
jgi:hypothetical protein